MNCQRCGAPLAQGQVFCPNCGTQQQLGQPQQQSYQPYQQPQYQPPYPPQPQYQPPQYGYPQPAYHGSSQGKVMITVFKWCAFVLTLFTCFTCILPCITMQSQWAKYVKESNSKEAKDMLNYSIIGWFKDVVKHEAFEQDGMIVTVIAFGVSVLATLIAAVAALRLLISAVSSSTKPSAGGVAAIVAGIFKVGECIFSPVSILRIREGFVSVSDLYKWSPWTIIGIVCAATAIILGALISALAPSSSAQQQNPYYANRY
ncbi:MAG: zinc ribbon domain-containing protein [Ruminococcus sp.]|nr:zinc ribbon domain-containing protein [Ruminococcus sp.]